MKFLAWNIQHGGGSRVARIIEEVSAHDPDVIAFAEFRARPGAVLLAELGERGWPYAETTEPLVNQNGIAVFSRTPLRRIRPCLAPGEHEARWLEIDLPEYRCGLAVLHIMAASGRRHPSGEAKACFWNAVLEAAQARRGEPFLFAGDWNTGAHRIDEAGRTFICAEQFRRLSAIGWTDLWRHHNPGITEWTWYSKRKGGARGNGFRLDHAFASQSLGPRVTSCRYSHVEREAGISDHSLMIVELD
jgi:exodeoxyribonuclease-3